MTDIGGQVMVSEKDLATIKLMSSTATKLARNLARILFSKEDLQGRSLFGRTCNANKTKPGPVVDAKKRNALISTYLTIFSLLFSTIIKIYGTRVPVEDVRQNLNKSQSA
jgi:hypothetical protein